MGLGHFLFDPILVPVICSLLEWRILFLVKVVDDAHMVRIFRLFHLSLRLQDELFERLGPSALTTGVLLFVGDGASCQQLRWLLEALWLRFLNVKNWRNF